MITITEKIKTKSRRKPDIGMQEMFNLHINDIETSFSALKESKESYLKTKKYLLEAIEPCKYYIENLTKVDYSKIHEASRIIPEAYYPIIVGFEDYRSKSMRFVNAIIEVNRRLDKTISDLNKIEKYRIDYLTYQKIVGSFNEQIGEAILNGYVFQMGLWLSHHRIKKHVKKATTSLKIDWFESKKKKEELIAQGKTPYKVLEYDNKKRPIRNNGGEKWFVYFNNPIDYTFYWAKRFCKITNHGIYQFKPTINSNNKGKPGLINKLKRMVKEDSYILKYFYP